MASDRARVSYDPTRQYRSVVAQQGRVTLEADVNEAQEIAAEALRAETIDVVGLRGAPDNGYTVAGVAGNTTRDFTIGGGTMYVGGQRVFRQGAIRYSQQTEWLDHAGDPLWRGPAAPHAAAEFICLFLREQEVSAVEDTALREVALGGPDTAQRKRLIQRIVRFPANAETCATGLAAAQAAWSGAGANFDAATNLLRSPATLKVELVHAFKAGTVCEPEAQGGYIGADNQMIRVQISQYGNDKRSGRFVWSFDNASFLHRTQPVDAHNPAVLQLITTPVDADHAPRANHPVEVLRSAVLLSENRDYVAAACGVIRTPTQDYEAGKPVILSQDLPANYRGGTHPLFLRLWEEELEFRSGQPVELSGTGLQIVIDLHDRAGSFTVGQFWMFAVRPNTSADIYPHRYLFQPQPPEGPRMWVCPLAAIGWPETGFKLLDDCRLKFPPLTDINASDVGFDNAVCAFPPSVKTVQDAIDALCRRERICSIVAGPTDDLQSLIDAVPAGADAHICLTTGTFTLPKTITIASKGHVLLHGSGPGTRLIAAKSECALRAVGCASLTVRDCALQGGAAGDGNAGMAHLSGALTVADCRSVEITSVALTCALAMKRAASGLTIHNTAADGTRVVVENCSVSVGHRQVGMLIVNVESARIRNNFVQPAGALPPAASRLRRRGIAKMMLQGLQVIEQAPAQPAAAPAAADAGTSREAAPPGGRTTSVAVAGSEVRFQADPALGLSAEDWQRFVTGAKPPQKLAPKAVRRWLLAAVDAAIAQAEREANPRSRIGQAIKGLLNIETVTPSQGIVVAGEHVGDLALTGNVVRQTLQGIHVGTSKQNTATPLYADRVYVSDNAVTVGSAAGGVARHGVFIGNCHSLHVLDNRIDASGPSPANEIPPPEGIRVFGFVGPFAIIRANHVSGLRIGIRFSPVGTPLPQRPQWVITDNFAEKAQEVLATPGATVRNKIRGAVDNYA